MERELLQENNQEFISKIKQINRKKKILTFVRFGIVFLLFVLLGTYLLTPLSTISNLTLTGNIYLDEDDIYTILNKKKNSSLYAFDCDEAEELLNNYPLISNAKVKINPFNLTINLNENAPVASYQNNLYTMDGKILSNEVIGDPLLASYFEQVDSHLSTFINNPEDGENDHFSIYLTICALINRETPMIKYLDMLQKKESFIFYYKLDGISSYLRVKLKYDSHYDVNTYVDKMNFSSSTMQTVVDDLKCEQEFTSIGDEEITYYAIQASLYSDRDGLKVSFERDL